MVLFYVLICHLILCIYFLYMLYGTQYFWHTRQCSLNLRSFFTLWTGAFVFFIKTINAQSRWTGPCFPASWAHQKFICCSTESCDCGGRNSVITQRWREWCQMTKQHEALGEMHTYKCGRWRRCIPFRRMYSWNCPMSVCTRRHVHSDLAYTWGETRHVN